MKNSSLFYAVLLSSLAQFTAVRAMDLTASIQTSAHNIHRSAKQCITLGLHHMAAGEPEQALGYFLKASERGTAAEKEEAQKCVHMLLQDRASEIAEATRATVPADAIPAEALPAAPKMVSQEEPSPVNNESHQAAEPTVLAPQTKQPAPRAKTRSIFSIAIEQANQKQVAIVHPSGNPDAYVPFAEAKKVAFYSKVE